MTAPTILFQSHVSAYRFVAAGNISRGAAAFHSHSVFHILQEYFTATERSILSI